MTHLRRRMQEDLRLRNFSERTVRHYIHTIVEFAKYFHRPPDQLGPEHVRTFLLYRPCRFPRNQMDAQATIRSGGFPQRNAP